jgi:hypothetical protein
MRSLLRIVCGATLGLVVSGCSHTVGPVVRDIQADAAGRLWVQTCNLRIGYRARSATMVDCVQKLIEPYRGPAVAER